MKRLILTLCVFFALATVINAAGIYDCIDMDGFILLTDNPPSDAKCLPMGGNYLLTPVGGQKFMKEATLKQSMAEQANHKTGCEIVSFNQYEKTTGVGTAMFPSTCVDLTIRNNDSVERTITNDNIVAVTQKGNSRSPVGFMAKIGPGGNYQGTACFKDRMSTISKLDCEF